MRAAVIAEPVIGQLARRIWHLLQPPDAATPTALTTSLS
jgi:hypothetical protein